MSEDRGKRRMLLVPGKCERGAEALSKIHGAMKGDQAVLENLGGCLRH
jgi:hypothetical protein